MLITPTTDLTQFTARRVTFSGGRVARLQTVRHGADAVNYPRELQGGIWGDLVEEPTTWYRGGASSYWLPYGTDLTIER